MCSLEKACRKALEETLSYEKEQLKKIKKKRVWLGDSPGFALSFLYAQLLPGGRCQPADLKTQLHLSFSTELAPTNPNFFSILLSFPKHFVYTLPWWDLALHEMVQHNTRE